MSVRAAIEEFFKASENPVLFAGAGVGARAGLPMWGRYIDDIADEVIAHDPICGQLMKKYVKDQGIMSPYNAWRRSPLLAGYGQGADDPGGHLPRVIHNQSVA